MFGVNRPVRFGEDCRKENSNRQPTVQTSSAAPTKRGTLQLQAQDPLRAADQPDRDYIASMDQAFAGHIKDAALSKKEPRPSSVPEKRLGEHRALDYVPYKRDVKSGRQLQAARSKIGNRPFLEPVILTMN